MAPSRWALVLAGGDGTGLQQLTRTLADICEELKPWNFSRRIVAHMPHESGVVPVEGVHWNDWGTRASIERTLAALDLLPPWLTRKPAATTAPTGT
jgi:hypothetical protein